ncbi:MAG: DegT/DnrJ/EryC1/StrS family aminotransferase [Gammaproteobacteria bacterium]|nr:DegT/DnrJ/EryC1/StrS family aminotransferase [Gammaproteobacteria bacterium]
MTHCLSAESVASLLSPRTRAIVPVHIFGHPADIDGLRAVIGPRDIALVEDCAQAHGARIGDPAGRAWGSPAPSVSIRPRTSARWGTPARW